MGGHLTADLSLCYRICKNVFVKQLNYHRARHGSLCFDILLVPKFDHYIKAWSFLQAEKLTTKPSPFGKINGLVKGK